MPKRPPIHRPAWAPSREESERRRKAWLDKHRPSSAARGYDSEWAEAARAFLAEPGNDRCSCGAPAVLVRHVLSITLRPDLRMARANWRPGCKSCNAADAHAERKRRPVER